MVSNWRLINETIDPATQRIILKIVGFLLLIIHTTMFTYQKSTFYFFRQTAHSVFLVDKWSQQVHDLSIKIFNKAP